MNMSMTVVLQAERIRSLFKLVAARTMTILRLCSSSELNEVTAR
jgi:hypothetical protein